MIKTIGHSFQQVIVIVFRIIMIIFSLLDYSLENLPLVLEHFVFFIFIVIDFVIDVFFDVTCISLIVKSLCGYLILLLNVSIVAVDVFDI